MRKKRILINGAKYLITAKINRGEEIFKEGKMKKLFIETIKRCKKKFSFSLKKIAFRNSEIYFVIKPDKNESLSKIMQWILTVFAMKYNSINNFGGHVWAGNYISEIVQ